MSTDSREQGLRVLEEMLGPEVANSTRKRWLEISPDFEHYVVEFLAGDIWKREGLDRRTRSLITIGALTALGRSRGLELNIRMALKNGASPEEINETLLHLAPYAGFPATWDALEIAHRVFKQDV